MSINSDRFKDAAGSCSDSRACIEDEDDDSSVQTDTMNISQPHKQRTKGCDHTKSINKNQTHSDLQLRRHHPVFLHPSSSSARCYPLIQSVIQWCSVKIRRSLYVPWLLLWILIIYRDGASCKKKKKKKNIEWSRIIRQPSLGNEINQMEQHDLMQKSWPVIWVVILIPF